MRIAELQLKTFRSYVNVALNLNSPRVLVSGANGTGKTSLRDAIAWCLTGRTPDLGGRDAGQMLVPLLAGASDANASVVIEGLGRVERRWTSAGQSLVVTNWTGGVQAQQQALYDTLHATETLLHVLCDARAFLNLDHAEAKGLLLGLLDVRVPVPESDVPVTLADLDARYQQAFEARKVAKRVVQQMGTPQEPVSALSYKPVDEYEARLVELRAELGALERAIGTTVGTREALQAQRATKARTRKAVLTPEQFAHREEACLEAKARRAKLPEPQAVVGSPERVTFLRSTSEALLGHKPSQGCVLDGRVPCKTPGTQFTKLASAYQDELDAMPKAADLPLDERASLDARIAEDEVMLGAHGQAVLFNLNLDSDLAALDARIAALPDVSAQEAVISEKRALIAKGEGITADARRYVAAREQYQKALLAREQAGQEVDRLDARCQVLGPTGARVQALEAALAGFLASVNPYLSPFGWTLAIQVQPWAVFVNGRAAQTYSASERYRIGVALQLAIAEASGLSFAVVDELDILDAAGTRKLATLIYNSPVQQVLILRTRNESDKLPPTLPGVVSYRLGAQEGRSVVLEKVEGEGVAA